MRTPLLGSAAVLLAAGLVGAQPPLPGPPSPYQSRLDGVPLPPPDPAPHGHAPGGHKDDGEHHPKAEPWMPKKPHDGEGHAEEKHGESHEEPEEAHHAPAPPIRLWFNGEYLIWFLKKDGVIPLVTTGQPDDPLPGAINTGFTRILFGNSDLDYQRRLGGRFTAGVWLDPEARHGFEASYLFLGSREIRYDIASDGSDTSQVIARPFINAATGLEDSEIAAFPSLLAGQVSVKASSRFDGLEGNGLANLCCGRGYRADLIAGLRYLQLEEGLGVSELSTVSPTSPVYAGTTIGVTDRFDVESRFYGGQLGARAEFYNGRIFVRASAKVALGVTEQVLTVAGQTLLVPPAGPAAVGNGGLLALPSNSGRFARNCFSVVPEVGVNLGYEVNRHLRMTVGYSFLYWSHVLRVGDQLDRTVNVTQVPTNLQPTILIFPPPGGLRPAVKFADTDLWAQGVNFGLELRY